MVLTNDHKTENKFQNKQIASILVCQTGQGSQNLQQLKGNFTLSGSTTSSLQHNCKNRLPNSKSKNNLITFWVENREIFKNSQLQTNFIGSYEKECSAQRYPLK